MAARWSLPMAASAAASARPRSDAAVMTSGSVSGPAGGCHDSSSSSGYGETGRRLRARWRSIAAFTAMRVSQPRNEGPRYERRFR